MACPKDFQQGYAALKDSKGAVISSRQDRSSEPQDRATAMLISSMPSLPRVASMEQKLNSRKFQAQHCSKTTIPSR
jgi:hypothetical protein